MTYKEMYSRVLFWLKDPGGKAKTLLVKHSINDSQTVVASILYSIDKAWLRQEETLDGTIQAGTFPQENLSKFALTGLASNLLEIVDIFYTPNKAGTDGGTLTIIDPNDWNAQKINTFYTPSATNPIGKHIGTNLFVLPPATGTEVPSIRITYMGTPVELTTDAQVSTIPAVFHILVCQYAFYLCVPPALKAGAREDFLISFQTLSGRKVADLIRALSRGELEAEEPEPEKRLTE